MNDSRYLHYPWAYLTNGGNPQSIMYIMTPAAQMSTFKPYLKRQRHKADARFMRIVSLTPSLPKSPVQHTSAYLKTEAQLIRSSQSRRHFHLPQTVKSGVVASAASPKSVSFSFFLPSTVSHT